MRIIDVAQNKLCHNRDQRNLLIDRKNFDVINILKLKSYINLNMIYKCT